MKRFAMLIMLLGMLTGCDSGAKSESKSAESKPAPVSVAPDIIKSQFETLQQSKAVESTLDAGAEARKKQLDAAEK